MTDIAIASLVAPAAAKLHRTRRACGFVLRRLLGILQAAEDRRQLHALSDYMLRDIGLAHDGIGEAVGEAARRQAERLPRHGG